MKRPPGFDPTEEDLLPQALKNLESILTGENLQILASQEGYVITSINPQPREFWEIWDLSNYNSARVLQEFINSLPQDRFLLIACDVEIGGKITIDGQGRTTFGGSVLIQSQAEIKQCHLENAENRRRDGSWVSVRNSGKIQICSVTSGGLIVDESGQVVDCQINCDLIRIRRDTKESVRQQLVPKFREKPVPSAVIHSCNITVRDWFEIGSGATVANCGINIESRPKNKAEVTVYDQAVVDRCTISAANAKIDVWGTVQGCQVLAAAELRLQFGSLVVNSVCHGREIVITSVAENCNFSGDRATLITSNVSACTLYFPEFEVKPGVGSGSLKNCQIIGHIVKITNIVDNCTFRAPPDDNMVITTSQRFEISNPKFVGPVTVQVVKPWHYGSFIDLPTEDNSPYGPRRYWRLVTLTNSGKKRPSDQAWTFLSNGSITPAVQKLIAELQQQRQLQVVLLGSADNTSGDPYEA